MGNAPSALPPDPQGPITSSGPPPSIDTAAGKAVPPSLTDVLLSKLSYRPEPLESDPKRQSYSSSAIGKSGFCAHAMIISSFHDLDIAFKIEL